MGKSSLLDLKKITPSEHNWCHHVLRNFSMGRELALVIQNGTGRAPVFCIKLEPQVAP
jgi:hypothetical protein